jgi:hypothetical protein
MTPLAIHTLAAQKILSRLAEEPFTVECEASSTVLGQTKRNRAFWTLTVFLGPYKAVRARRTRSAKRLVAFRVSADQAWKLQVNSRTEIARRAIVVCSDFTVKMQSGSSQGDGYNHSKQGANCYETQQALQRLLS